MNRFIFLLIVIGMIIPVFSCTTHDSSRMKFSSIEEVEQGQQQAEAPFVLGEGDEVAVHIWRYEDLTRTVQIDPAGHIYLPLAGDIKAAGLTIPELRKAVTESLSAYINGPQVDINLTSISSRKMHVFGEVSKTGTVILNRRMKVLDAISESGGFSRDADKSRVLLFRKESDGTNRVFALNVDFRDMGKNGGLSENFRIQNGDVLYVPPLKIADLETFMGRLNTILSPVISVERGIALWPEVSDALSGEDSDGSGIVVAP